MAGRIVNNLEIMIPPSQLHLSDLREKHNHLRWESQQGSQDGMVYLG